MTSLDTMEQERVKLAEEYLYKRFSHTFVINSSSSTHSIKQIMTMSDLDKQFYLSNP